MGQFATAIPEKIFFKIGEVCDLVGVQAHVLRYWETEFPMLSPQKNRSGQRSYRRRDVEIAMRVKELLYDDLYTIAGAKKKLQVEMREPNRLKIVHSEPTLEAAPVENLIKEAKLPDSHTASNELNFASAPVTESSIRDFGAIDDFERSEPIELNEERREALTNLAAQLLELREMLKAKKSSERDARPRNF